MIQKWRDSLDQTRMLISAVLVFASCCIIHASGIDQAAVNYTETEKQHAAQESRSRIIFMCPKNSDSEYTLNGVEDTLMGSQFRRGWNVNANEAQLFDLYLLVKSDSDSVYSTTIIRNRKSRHLFNGSRVQNETTTATQYESHIYYIFFTTNPVSCSDYLNYQHIPLILKEPVEGNNITRPSLIRSEVSFTLRHDPINPYYICLGRANPEDNDYYEDLAKNGDGGKDYVSLDDMFFHHQGTEVTLTFITEHSVMSLWLKCVIYAILVLFNSILNGLNIGLMTLSVKELELLIKTSDSMKERQYAKKILPLRKKGNYLLCSILLSIALTGSVSVLVLDNILEGLLAGIFSTVILCIIGEILPQSLCTKYSLPIGSYTRHFTYVCIFVTSIASYPLSRIVDLVLGKELPVKYSRDAIKELVKKSKGLQEQQCRIISAALDLKTKHVSDIMVELVKVFMLNIDDKLNFETMAIIYDSGYSRIPVYQTTRSQIAGWIHIKDLTMIDPEDEIRVNKLMEFYHRKMIKCKPSHTIVELFEKFQRSSTHLAFVENESDEKNVIGIVTLHDVLQALFQSNLGDDSKTGINYLKRVIDNQKQGRSSLVLNKINPGDSFNKLLENTSFKDATVLEKKLPQLKVSWQTKFNILQILCNIKPFKQEFIEKSVLEKLVDNDEIYMHKFILKKTSQVTSQMANVYTYQEPVDFFVLIVEGCLIVEAGQEKTEFLAKQYDHFGSKALLGECENRHQVLENTPEYHPYIPEYSLKIDFDNKYRSVTERGLRILLYLKIDRNTWLQAVKATCFKRNHSNNGLLSSNCN